MKKKIAVLAGDGIGPEVMVQTQRVLDAIAARFNHQFDYLEGAIGGSAYETFQTHCPEQTLAICQEADAILFGSVGGPVSAQQQAKWKGCEAKSILTLRQHFNLTINIRPVKVYPQLAVNCPLKQRIIEKGIDCVIFRELTGGLYFGKHQHFVKNHQRFATDESIYDEGKIRHIAHAAFKAAQQRHKRVCSVDKANVLATSLLWREIVNDVASHYKDVALTHMLVDNCVMQMVLNPHQFDVIVTENMFGDIISDLAAALPGSLGLMPSASLSAQGGGLYEPSGGSAPEIAGKGIANPCAQLLSAAMMLRYAFAWHNEADLIDRTVMATIASGKVTRDLANDNATVVSTAMFVDDMVRRIES